MSAANAIDIIKSLVAYGLWVCDTPVSFVCVLWAHPVVFLILSLYLSIIFSNFSILITVWSTVRKAKCVIWCWVIVKLLCNFLSGDWPMKMVWRCVRALNHLFRSRRWHHKTLTQDIECWYALKLSSMKQNADNVLNDILLWMRHHYKVNANK